MPHGSFPWGSSSTGSQPLPEPQRGPGDRTRDSAAFWAFAERVSQKMESWPEWQRRAADAVLFTRPAERVSESVEKAADSRGHDDAVGR